MRPPHTVYRGERLSGPRGQCLGVKVTVNGRPLTCARSLQIRRHSPDGFEWGYRGSGPAQLALALVLDATDSPLLAGQAYQWFKEAVVGDWPDTWQITAGEIFEWLDRFRNEELAREKYAKGGAV